jgi:hypothetical protein
MVASAMYSSLYLPLQNCCTRRSSTLYRRYKALAFAPVFAVAVLLFVVALCSLIGPPLYIVAYPHIYRTILYHQRVILHELTQESCSLLGVLA